MLGKNDHSRGFRIAATVSGTALGACAMALLHSIFTTSWRDLPVGDAAAAGRVLGDVGLGAAFSFVLIPLAVILLYRASLERRSASRLVLGIAVASAAILSALYYLLGLGAPGLGPGESPDLFAALVVGTALLIGYTLLAGGCEPAPSRLSLREIQARQHRRMRARQERR